MVAESSALLSLPLTLGYLTRREHDVSRQEQAEEKPREPEVGFSAIFELASVGAVLGDVTGRAQAARSALAPPFGLAGTLSALSPSATVVDKQGPLVGPVEVERISAVGCAA